MAIVAVAGDLLDPGVGTWVEDTEAPSWTIDTASPGDGAWKDVTFPWMVSAEAVTGTIAETGAEVLLTFQQADDSSGTNEEIIGAFPLIEIGDDDLTFVIPLEITKRYVQVVSATPVTASGTITVTLRDLDYHRYSRVAHDA